MNIKHGEKLFEFRSRQDWFSRAHMIWRLHQVRAQSTVCVDQLGRICGWGEHFMQAERDNAYPIEVFMLREDMTHNAVVQASGAPTLNQGTAACSASPATES